MRRTSPTSFFWVPFLSLIQTATTLPDLDTWSTSLIGRCKLKIRHVLGGTCPYGSNLIMDPSGGQVSKGSGKEYRSQQSEFRILIRLRRKDFGLWTKKSPSASGGLKSIVHHLLVLCGYIAII